MKNHSAQQLVLRYRNVAALLSLGGVLFVLVSFGWLFAIAHNRFVEINSLKKEVAALREARPPVQTFPDNTGTTPKEDTVRTPPDRTPPDRRVRALLNTIDSLRANEQRLRETCTAEIRKLRYEIAVLQRQVDSLSKVRVRDLQILRRNTDSLRRPR